MKLQKVMDFLSKKKNSDVKLQYKTTKLKNCKYILQIKGLEVSEEQLKELGINVKTSGEEKVPRESKPPKWAQDLVKKVESMETTPPKWFQEYEERINKRFDRIENTPTMKKELAEMNKNND